MNIIKIPRDRVGCLIGAHGSTRMELERESGIRLEIDTEGEVVIHDEMSKDPLKTLKLIEVIKAVGRGFSPERAWRLFQDDEYMEIIDIREYTGKKVNQVSRVRARLIGTGGKTRALIEDLTGANLSIYGSSVSIIGNSIQLPVARHAVDLLLRGSEHATVYRYLERQRPYLRITEMGFDL